jgi:hypothetical protein
MRDEERKRTEEKGEKKRRNSQNVHSRRGNGGDALKMRARKMPPPRL